MEQSDFTNFLIPTIVERDGRFERAYDIYSRLLKDRIVFLGSQIDSNVANVVIAQLLFLDQEEDSRDILLYINSPGGVLSAGLAILDTMNYVKADVQTICVGMAASMGAILLANGAKGKRLILPHAKVMIHQPIVRGGGIGGQVTDITITAKQLQKDKDRVKDVLASLTGQPAAKVERDVERDHWLLAQEAVDYGVADKVIKANLKK